MDGGGGGARRWAPPWPRLLVAAAAVALLAVLAARLASAAWADSLTFDETRYVRTGVCGVTTRTADLEVSNPPLHKLLAGAAVVVLGQRPAGADCSSDDAFFPRDPYSLRRLVLAARVPAMLLTLVCAVVVLLWATTLYGAVAGLCALALVAAEPTLAGHGHLATGDLPVSLGILATLAAHQRWTATARRRWLAVAGVALGLALLAKASALVVVVAVAVAAGASATGTARSRLRAALRDTTVVAVLAWAVVCVAYLPLTQTHHDWGAPLSWVAPPSWFDSVRTTIHDRSSGHLAYLNGTIRPAERPFAVYFVETLALKTTPATLLLALAGVATTAVRRDRVAALWMWLPCALLVVAATLGAVDVGVRYVLPVYPLVAVAASSVAAPGLRAARVRVAVVATAAAGALVAGLLAGTEQIGYVNSFGGARPSAYLSDSNLDWGQDLWRLRDRWVADGRPPMSLALFTTLSAAHYGIDGVDVAPLHEPVSGRLAASVTRITVVGDSLAPPYRAEPYAALQRRTPLERVGTSIEVFDMGPPPGTTVAG